MIRILVGNIGTGKTNYVREKCENFVVWNDHLVFYMLNMREILVTVPDFKDNFANKLKFFAIERCIKDNLNLVIEGYNETFLKRKLLIDMIGLVDKNTGIEAIDFGIGNKYTLAKKLFKCKKFDKNKWREIHETIQKNYEKPKLDEGFTRVDSSFKKI